MKMTSVKLHSQLTSAHYVAVQNAATLKKKKKIRHQVRPWIITWWRSPPVAVLQRCCSAGKRSRFSLSAELRTGKPFHLGTDRRTSRQMDGLMDEPVERGDQWTVEPSKPCFTNPLMHAGVELDPCYLVLKHAVCTFVYQCVGYIFFCLVLCFLYVNMYLLVNSKRRQPSLSVTTFVVPHK